MLNVMAQTQGLSISNDRFVSHFVHDLRACLRAADALPDWIEEDLKGVTDKLPESVHRHLADIKTNAQRADRLINSVRELCNLDDQIYASEIIDLRQTVQAVVNDSATPSDFEIKVEMVEQLCLVPPDAVQSVVRALLDNAFKHYGTNAGTVIVTNIDTQGALWVSDNGQGILERYHESIFDPFATLQSRDIIEGSGLGLTIARKQVENWGGTLKVIPEGPLKGATLQIKF
ncbi:sensor histidine kinase [Pacificibacter marinus]|uniref:histidine kinase n=1 Tax=Pacificibacter marinus TaxID=658057 RepID=A0A1Y5SLQ7_9RHOB|nr:HAMP domain-containing sensor histidine kinase [Pacificibacter marinus]SEL42992.1 Histidine kinase-, DNA gyrase B-, and HSP90-like ATPase [Pacificibacter marinus]SLN43092.1 putative sensor histidine kinase TcrY [Pacificibacter marinus]